MNLNNATCVTQILQGVLGSLARVLSGVTNIVFIYGFIDIHITTDLPTLRDSVEERIRGSCRFTKVTRYKDQAQTVEGGLRWWDMLYQCSQKKVYRRYSE